MKQDGGRAFPSGISIEQRSLDCGMTLRDYFAARAMSSLIAKLPLHDRQGEHGVYMPKIEDIGSVRQDVAQSSYDYADAMIAEREK